MVSVEDTTQLEKKYTEILANIDKAKSSCNLETADKLYLKAAAQIFPLGMKDVRLAKILINSGQLLIEMKKLLEAEIELRAALNLLEINDKAEPADIAGCSKNLGEVYFLNENWIYSKYYYQKALQIQNQLKADTSEAEAKLKLIEKEM